MSGQTKLIIITSDEDIIQQFSLSSTNNIQIIDLDNVKQTTSNQKNDNQLLKRSRDSSDQKTVKTPRKSLNLTCLICGGRAIGFNYDVLSCASCKAFFSRNANVDKKTIPCLTGQGQCSILHTIQHKCRKCRLEKCFTVGMRKDFLQSDEQKQKKIKCLEENFNLTSQRLTTSESPSLSIEIPPFSDGIDDLMKELDHVIFNECNQLEGIEEILFGKLSIEDWKIIENLQESFISFFRIPNLKGIDTIDLSDRVTALVTWSTFINQLALRFINFIRQISEFEELNFDDRLILIKYNLFPVFPLCKCYNYEQQYQCCPYNSAEEDDRHHRFFTLFGVSNNIRNDFLNVVVSLVQITEQDPRLLSLLLLILLFTPGLSMSEDAPPLHDSLSVYRAQCHYTKVLWNYLVDQSGEMESCRRLNQLVSLIFRIQSATKEFRLFFRDQCRTLNAVDQITPLMQTVLNIF